MSAINPALEQQAYENYGCVARGFFDPVSKNLGDPVDHVPPRAFCSSFLRRLHRLRTCTPSRSCTPRQPSDCRRTTPSQAQVGPSSCSPCSVPHSRTPVLARGRAAGSLPCSPAPSARALARPRRPAAAARTARRPRRISK